MAVPKGRVRIVVRGGDDFLLALGREPPRITDGYGGWEIVDHPKKLASLNWTGQKPYQMTVPFMINGFRDGTIIDDRVNRLEQLGRAPGGDDEPPEFRMYFTGEQPRSGKAVLWVAETIEWQDEIYDEDGKRLRQGGVLTVLQSNPTELISIAKRRKKKKGKGKRFKPKKRTYTVKAGDTIKKIINKMYGNPKSQHAHTEIKDKIYKVNKIRDPRQLTRGRVLKLPEVQT